MFDARAMETPDPRCPHDMPDRCPPTAEPAPPPRASPRVLIDGYFLDRVSGFGRYVRELVHALDGLGPHDAEIVLLVPRPLAALARAIAPHLRVETRAARHFALWEQCVVPHAARQLGCDLVHFPYQSTALAWPRAASVCTIHDLMFLRPSGSSGTLVDRVLHGYRRVLFSLHTRHARRLIAVSHATQEQLRAHSRSVSRVILNSVAQFVSDHRGVAAADRGRYFLHRGGGPHKNTDRVVSALAQVRADHPDVRLVVYGSVPAAARATHRDDPAVQYVGKVSDATLAALFKGAVAVVSPSTEEGFGLATIEAFGFGTPAITSDQPPMSDVAGGAALVVDPASITQIADALQQVLSDPACGRRLRAAGDARYATFASPQAYAQQLSSLYREAAGTGL